MQIVSVAVDGVPVGHGGRRVRREIAAVLNVVALRSWSGSRRS
jgi:hypothetical protein